MAKVFLTATQIERKNMSHRVERKLRNGASTENLPRFRSLRLVSTGSVARTKPVVATRNGLNIQDGQRFKVWNLHELKAENAELRNTAIQLALEIQDLRMGV
jgi:hypothetical protein